MCIENSWFFCVQAQHSVQATALKNETSLSLILKRDIIIIITNNKTECKNTYEICMEKRSSAFEIITKCRITCKSKIRWTWF